MVVIDSSFIIAKDAFRMLIIFIILFIIGLFLFQPLSIVSAIIILFLLFFFRNPRRNIRQNENHVLSPADGKVMSIEKVAGHDYFPDQEVWKVTIFLSLLNVHINRVPLSGNVSDIKYVNGDFFPAFKSHAAENNERNYLLINTQKGNILVVQITGFLARRIICKEKVGNYITQGDQFGLIKFGSCTELYIPTSFNIAIQEGEKVKGGITVIGRYLHE